MKILIDLFKAGYTLSRFSAVKHGYNRNIYWVHVLSNPETLCSFHNSMFWSALQICGYMWEKLIFLKEFVT